MLISVGLPHLAESTKSTELERDISPFEWQVIRQSGWAKPVAIDSSEYLRQKDVVEFILQPSLLQCSTTTVLNAASVPYPKLSSQSLGSLVQELVASIETSIKTAVDSSTSPQEFQLNLKSDLEKLVTEKLMKVCSDNYNIITIKNDIPKELS